jgi:hypothetical protein
MVHLVLTGATGLIGNAIVHYIQSIPPNSTAPAAAITKLSILSRSPVPLASNPNRTNTKTEISVIEHKDYLSYSPELMAQLSDASALIWAQGVSTMNGPPAAEYSRITKDFPMAAARAFADAKAKHDAAAGSKTAPTTPVKTLSKFNFVYISGEGATHTPGLFTQMFARVKGEAELALMALGRDAAYRDNLAIYCPRPGGVIPPKPSAKKGENGDPAVYIASADALMKTRPWQFTLIAKTALPVYERFNKKMLITTPELARVLVEMALRDGGEPYEAGEGIENDGRVIGNIAIRRFSGL